MELTATRHSHDPEQDQGTGGCRDQAADQAMGAQSQQPEDEASHQRTDNTDPHIAKKSEAIAFHDDTGQPARNSTDDQKKYQSQGVLPLQVAILYPLRGASPQAVSLPAVIAEMNTRYRLARGQKGAPWPMLGPFPGPCRATRTVAR